VTVHPEGFEYLAAHSDHPLLSRAAHARVLRRIDDRGEPQHVVVSRRTAQGDQGVGRRQPLSARRDDRGLEPRDVPPEPLAGELLCGERQVLENGSHRGLRRVGDSHDDRARKERDRLRAGRREDHGLTLSFGGDRPQQCRRAPIVARGPPARQLVGVRRERHVRPERVRAVLMVDERPVRACYLAALVDGDAPGPPVDPDLGQPVLGELERVNERLVVSAEFPRGRDHPVV
jgi:hypothetical protein